MIGKAAGLYEPVHRTSSVSGDSSYFFKTGLGNAPNLIQAFEADGFQVGTKNEVNKTGTLYYWIAFNRSSLLPIELVSFTAKVINNNQVEINWTTASETNNDYFTVERSSNGVEFEEIGSVKGVGNSNKTLNYSFKDENPSYGVLYYRLKQTDYDGNYEYSEIVTIRNDVFASGDIDIKIFPNPCKSGSPFNILYNNPSTNCKEILAVLYNCIGEVVFSKVIIQEDEGTLMAIDPNRKLAPGIYLVIGSSSNKIEFKRKLVIN